ncbi:TBC1 domain family member 5-like isoform X2 [Dreissena polymorpha]|uniref:TBC1 domain family member 5-like isoform X2 n=1 Tax=Dreissena polymorpha TaxID=45954 RepID=UPI0022643286|nr:TBC1 domain family member 5-like isoform X2 [Dreissena polymorpha]
MEKMMSKLRSLSGSKLNTLTSSVSKATTSAASSNTSAPSKEDILSTLDGFGEKIQDPIPHEDNNNINIRHTSSVASVNSSSCMDTSASDSEPTITSITHSYSLEWEKLFMKPGYLRHLKNYALKGNLRSSRFRSIAWKLFLEVLPEESTQWLNRTRHMRQKYMELKDKLIVNPRKAVDTVDLSFNNPLSQEDESPWNRFFLDNELRLTIKQDVIRTYPRIEFFQSNQLRNLMVDILFIYAKLNPEVSYRQGMHELLAPMIFVLHCDHQAFLHASEMESLEEIEPSSRERIRCVLDPKYLEHDAYAMFAQVMQTVEPWYVSKEVYPTKADLDPTATQPFAKPQDLNPSNVIVTKLTRIQDYLLKKADHELHVHLERQEIAPQIYGIRWIRLLFGREFPMQDLLVLWDAIFADSIGFDLVDYIFVAMLLYLRDHLLSIDYPSCLITLMRYPPVGDIHYFIDKARYLRDPHQFPRPPTYTYQSVQTAERFSPAQPTEMAPLKPSNSSSGTLQSLTRKLYSTSRPKTLTAPGRQKLSKSSSEPMNLQTDISPVSPTPGAVPQHKRGSSASLSQVEDSVFRSVQSHSSLGRFETQSLQSPATTPDNVSIPESPTRYATMPNRGKAKKQVKQAVPPSNTEVELASVRGLLHEKQSMCTYCASKLDHHIERLQAELLHQVLKNEDEIMVAIAGIKQVRDVLKGTLRWSQNLGNADEDISISDDHYKMEVASSSTSPTTDSSPGALDSPDRGCQGNKATEKRLFYVSSEENSEAIDSPSEAGAVAVGSGPINFGLPVNRIVEMEDLNAARYRGKDKRRNSPSRGKSGPNNVESDFSNSWSPESGHSEMDQSPDSEMEESPNPLYRIRHSSYNL